MGGVLLVQVAQGAAQLFAPVDHVFFRICILRDVQPLTVLAHDLMKVLAGHIVHHDIEGIVLVDDVVNMHDIGVIEILHDVSLFAHEVHIDTMYRIACVVLDLLDGLQALQALVTRQPHHRHAALTQLLDDGIALADGAADLGISHSDHPP